MVNAVNLYKDSRISGIKNKDVSLMNIKGAGAKVPNETRPEVSYRQIFLYRQIFP